MHEHYCRRWAAVSLLRRLDDHQRRAAKGPLLLAQRARFINSETEYFLLALARPLALTHGSSTSVTLGFPLDETFKQTARFWDDPAVPRMEVNETCERCGLTPAECQERAAPPHVYENKIALDTRRKALDALLSQSKS
jgi:hypothetical protein